jgi:hypothetical protein
MASFARGWLAMRRSALRVLPWALLALTLALLALFLGFGLTRRPIEGLTDFDATDVTFIVSFVAFAPMGALIASRRPENPIGWIACGIGLLNVVSGAAFEYAARALLMDPGSLPGGELASWLSAWTWAPGLALVAFLMLLFPTGSPPTRRWRWVGWVAAANILVLVVGAMSLWSRRGPVLLKETIPSAPLQTVVELTWTVMLVLLLVSLASLIVRFRRARGEERQQLKWLAYVAAVVSVLLFNELFLLEWLGAGATTFGIVSENLLNLSATTFPIAAAIAITKYRLYDIDLVINRTLVYGALTVLLALAYFVIVVALQNIIPGADDSDLTIAGSTLAVAALFRPLRARVQGFIDRRFYRRKFDAQLTLESFSSRLREDVDLDHLSADLMNVVRNAMQPAHASLWLRTSQESQG